MRVSKSPPGTRGTVQLRLPHRSLRRWHLSLAETLIANGHLVRIDYVDATLPEVPGLSLLALFENTLFGAPAAEDLSEPIGALAFGSFVSAMSPRVVIDCTGAPLPDTEGRVLVPDFDGRSEAEGLLDALLDQRMPGIGWRRVSDNALIRHGLAAIAQPHMLNRSFNQTLGRLVSMAPTAVRAIQEPGQDTATAHRQPSGLIRVSRHMLGTVAGRLSRRLTQRLDAGAQWNIGWRQVERGQGLLATASLAPETYRWVPRKAGAYLADPFPFEHQGRIWLFCEEYPYATGKGVISVAECAADGTPGPFRPVLETGYHLSYPAVFAREGEVYMIPETTANRTLELYRADPFPDRWVLQGVLAEDVSWADATLFDHGGRVWLATTTTDCGGSDRDNLCLFHASRFGDPFEPHPLNPVIVDARGARPAGWMERDPGGKWLRPAQDCSGGYGWGLMVARIDRLDREAYQETVLARIPPPASLGATGLHTVNRVGAFEAIDAIL